MPAGRQGERAHRAPMKRPEESDELVASRSITGELDRRFHRLGSRVAEVHFLRASTGCDGRQLLGEIHHATVVEVGTRLMCGLRPFLRYRFIRSLTAMP